MVYFIIGASVLGAILVARRMFKQSKLEEQYLRSWDKR